MDFELPDDAKALIDTTRKMVRDLMPHEPEFQKTDKVPDAVGKVFSDNGFFSLAFREENGGMGLGMLEICCIQAELAHLPVQFWADVKSSQGPQTKIIEDFGTEAQRQATLPKVIAGDLVMAFCLSEPHCGSDVSAIRTHAERKGDGWVLNGYKTYVSNGIKAGQAVVAAYTDRSKGAKDGISLFLVPADAPGYKLAGILELMGHHTPGVAELAFDDVELPAGALIGEEGKGLSYLMHGLNAGRLAIAGTSLGMGEMALEEARHYARERPAFGGTLSDFQAVQHMLADMATEMRAARLLMLDAAWRYDRGEVSRSLCAMAKLFCSEASGRTVDTALQVFGGAGYVRGQRVERLYRDVRVTRIYEGASEIQKNTIAREMLRD